MSGLQIKALAPCVFLFVVAAIGFWIWMVIDCATNEPSEGNDKLAWMLAIILTGWIGALIYFFARRPMHGH